MQIDYENLTGEWVAFQRRERGWTQEELARRLAELGEPLHSTALTRLEKGKRAIRLNEWFALLTAFDESVHGFVNYLRTVIEWEESLGPRVEQELEQPKTPIEVAELALSILDMANRMLRESLRDYVPSEETPDGEHQEA